MNTKTDTAHLAAPQAGAASDVKAEELRAEIERNEEVARLILNNDHDAVTKWAKGLVLRQSHPSPRFIAESAEIDAVRAEIAALRASHSELVKALEDAIFEYERNTCTHEETHRGGAIWTICDSCGAKWADDRGGFVPYKDPPKIESARTALATAKGLQ